ncbi:MAG: SDR family oxidoreductase [Chthoniobacterales bacterium]
MRRILITGASRGIGRAIAERLAGAGTALLLHGRDRNALAQTCQAVEAAGGAAQALAFDLRAPDEVAALIAAAGDEPLDALIHNAGIAVVKPLQSISQEEWRATLAVNVTAPFLLTQAFARRMKPGASILNVLSIAAKSGFANWSAYCMSKFALEGFSQAVREELRPRGIRVLNIYPAATNTGIWDAVEGEWPREKMLPPAEIADAVVFALSRPPGVAIENIDLSNLAGRL